ncbi:hypothetical protein [Streptomyces sp. NPDC048650]|uniref:hypothetical protein n=1 Tax=unclassified Streptomyces TaxID=2593676 RepID=UPI00370FB298
MRRATSLLLSVVVAIAATAVGCLLVLTLLPSHARPWPTAPMATGAPAPAAAPRQASITGHGGSAARAATTGLGTDTHRPRHAPRRGRIAVTAPMAGLSFRVNGSFSVAWTNNTGHDVDVWLSVRTKGKRTQRLALVAPRAGSASVGEALVTLPRVSPGRAYALEVAAGDGVTRAFSTPFAVTS